jgi:glycosyltransferase involved in cell wall biosynthesis
LVQPSVLAIVPAHNEAAHIAEVILGVKQHLPVLVIDDGSQDETYSISRQAGADVIALDANSGKGTALQCGFRYALSHTYQAALTLDADGQHDPADIPAFLHAYIEKNADLIIGERDFRLMPLARQTGNSVGRFLLSWAAGAEIRDNQSGYRLVSRRMMAAALERTETGFEFEVGMIFSCLKSNYQLAWVPIRTIYLNDKSHIQPFRHSLRFIRLLWNAMELRNQMRRDKRP